MLYPIIGTSHGTSFWINCEFYGVLAYVGGSILCLFGMLSVTFILILPWLGHSFLSHSLIGLYYLFNFMAAYTQVIGMITDPGSVPRNAQPLEDNSMNKYCDKCQAFKPLRAHHCRVCKRCIVRMDHHCPWFNNCVGIGNQKLIFVLVFWIAVICGYSLLIIFTKTIYCSIFMTRVLILINNLTLYLTYYILIK